MEDPDVIKLQKMLTDIAQSKPPVGKATIVEVSKASITAIRHFKHVVHLIEKFILKCKSHHKLYGFYMIDSIVRQAQKKFKHKDVFGPRFAINMRQTLENALTCPAKERPKIVRLLNLWSANNIFEEDTLRPLLQHCRASGLDVDAENVEKAVKGEKADMTRYGNGGLNISPMKSVAAASASAPPNVASSNPETVVLKLLSSVNPDYEKIFSSNSRAFRKVQELLKENVKKHLGSQSKNKISNILSADFDYSDDESGDENKNAVDIDSIPQEQIDKTTESLFKNSKILDEIRNIYYENGGADSHGSSSKHDDRDRKRKRSRSSSRDRNSDRKREKSRRSKERERSREKSYRRRSSSPPRHRDEDKREKERRKLGFPSQPHHEHLIIGSRTLWLGKLSQQNCQESEIRNALSDYGTIERIQVIQSRVCAYVTMADRRTAYKIIDKMSNKLEIGRKLVKVSWATGQGLKGENKLNDFWNGEKGYHEIPWSSLPTSTQRIGNLFEGGCIDVDTLPPKFKGIFDEKGKPVKQKSPERAPEQQQNLSHVPLPPPEQQPIIQQPPQQNSMPTGIPPPMPLQNFQPGMLPPGLNLTLDNKDPNIEMLIASYNAANGNNNQAGILGPPPSMNPATIMNTFNAMNVRTQLANFNRPPFPRHDGPLPDQQAAFQHFRGVNPPRFGNDFNNPPGLMNPPPRHFIPPPMRGGFNNGNGFPLPDMSNPPPHMMGERPPMHFNIPPPRLAMNFAQPPPTLNPPPNLNSSTTLAEHQEEPMDIASPDGPPGV